MVYADCLYTYISYFIPKQNGLAMFYCREKMKTEIVRFTSILTKMDSSKLGYVYFNVSNKYASRRNKLYTKILTLKQVRKYLIYSVFLLRKRKYSYSLQPTRAVERSCRPPQEPESIAG